MTDSGGIQEEVTAPSLQKRVLVMRESTERPEAVEAGFAVVVGTKSAKILKAAEFHSNMSLLRGVASPFGDGKSGERIVKLLKQDLGGACS